MKLSIIIFVLATIIYQYQCAPTLDWLKDLNNDLQNMNQGIAQQMQKNQQELNKFFETLHQDTENRKKQFEEEMKNMGKSLTDMSHGLQGSINVPYVNTGGNSIISSSQNVNGYQHHSIIERIANNIEYRTEIEYNPVTKQTTTKKYECTLSSNRQCTETSNDVKPGPPSMY